MFFIPKEVATSKLPGSTKSRACLALASSDTSGNTGSMGLRVLKGQVATESVDPNFSFF